MARSAPNCKLAKNRDHPRCQERLGLAPPAKQQAARAAAPFDPWTSEAEQKRLALYFAKARSADAQALVPSRFPAHIKPYAEFMRRQAATPATSRDVVKAYLLTVGSMQRSAIGAEKVPWAAGSGKVRPEDALGALMQSPAGQCYLDDAARGVYNAKCANTLVKKFGAYGKGPGFKKQLKGAVALGQRAPEIDRLLKSARPKAWYTFVGDNVPGISVAKAGFFASLLGRGDMATADARELNFWLCPPREWDRTRRACRHPLAKTVDDVGKLVDVPFMNLFNKRMGQLKVPVPARYKPFYAHLAHHALWDAIGGTKTTHRSVITAMEKA